MKVSVPLSTARARYTTKGAIVNFFNFLKRQIREKGIKTANIANINKYGIQEGKSIQGKVLGTALTRQTYKKILDLSFWISIIKYITGVEKRLLLVVIYKGEELQVQQFINKILKQRYKISPKGWTNI